MSGFDKRSNERIAKEIKQHERRVRGKIATGRASPSAGVNFRMAIVSATAIGRRTQPTTPPNELLNEFTIFSGKVRFYNPGPDQAVDSAIKYLLDEEEVDVFNMLNRAFVKGDEVFVSGNLIVGVNLQFAWNYKLFEGQA